MGSSSSSGTGSSSSSNKGIYDGVIQVGTGANSNRFVNGAGEVIQLRGANMSGLETTAVHGWTTDPWGDDGGTPDWAAYATWKPNIVRLPLCAPSWMGWNVAPTTGAERSPSWGTVRSADPGSNYRQVVIAAVAAAQAIGCYVIIDLHWTSPQLTLGGVTHYLIPDGQSAFADVSSAIPFWQSIAQTFGTQATPATAGINNKGIMFELFNEPYMNQNGGVITTAKGGGSALTADEILGQGGWSNSLINWSQPGSNFVIYQDWEVAGYQQMLDTVRATGAKNICIVNGNYYTQDLTAYQTYKPTDSLNQIAFGWHPYVQYTTAPNGGYPYSTSPYYFPSCGVIQASTGKANAASLNPANDVLAAGYPVICTEDGGFGGIKATNGEKHMAYMQSWADSSGASYVFWQWNNTQPYGTAATNNYLTVFASDGTTILPIRGAGQVTYDWMVNHS